jgi:protease I
MLAKSLSARRVLMVIYRRFEEAEYGVPRTMLEENGATIMVASSSRDVLRGHEGMEVSPDVALSEVRAGDYDAIVFIGGYAYQKDDPEAQRVVREAAAGGRLVAAICVAPITLAKAGVIDGKRVTASTGHAELRAAGGILSNAAVERDGLIITANGPRAARAFGEAIVAALEE